MRAKPEGARSQFGSVVVGVAATLLIVAAAQVALWRSASIRTLLTGEPVEVSMISLIGDPGHYDGVRVRVIGYMQLGFEADQLCDSREASDIRDVRSCVRIDRTPAMPITAAQYELIEGTFFAREHGHTGLFGGTLKKITRSDNLSSRLDH